MPIPFSVAPGLPTTARKDEDRHSSVFGQRDEKAADIFLTPRLRVVGVRRRGEVVVPVLLLSPSLDNKQNRSQPLLGREVEMLFQTSQTNSTSTTTTTTTTTAAAAPQSPMEEEDDGSLPLLPRPALRWTLQHNVTSDAELAILSNVCRSWRAWALEYVLEVTTGTTTSSGEASPTGSHPDDGSSRTEHLLLPSMMRAFDTQPQQKKKTKKHTEKEIIAEPTPDHFCIAWFASEGIQQLSWTQLLREDAILENMLLEVQDSAASRDLTDSLLETMPSDPSERQSAETTHQQPQQQRPPPKRSSAVAAAATTQVALQQAAAAASSQTAANNRFSWQRRVPSAMLSNEWRGYREPVQVLTPFGYTPFFVTGVFDTLRRRRPPTSVLDTEEEDDEDYSHATFAVRGVTVARPESFCLCTDRVTGGGGRGDHATRVERLRDRKELRRSVLPRVVKRGNDVDGTGPPLVMQFLNVDKASAVTMLTPALACGTLREPFTVFLVGIATEDGCFLSGLRRRFELGHLYPKDQLAEITDSSAVCLFTEDSSPSLPAAEADSGHEDKDPKQGIEDEEENDDAMSDDIWDDDDDEEFRDGSGCTCVFEGATEKLMVLEDHDEERGRLVRGVLGPGAWHCYTFVVDGVHSVIRVDGLEEPMEVHQPRDLPALLDGITLGSDHCFGTSLCCGQGSPGEGEGAIAEVALFKGRLDEQDIVTLESHLMKKHAIPPQNAEPWMDDDLHRQARAMFQLVANPRGNRVPLKYFAKSPNVAWKVYHPVTHHLIKKDRIGARNDETSSTFG